MLVFCEALTSGRPFRLTPFGSFVPFGSPNWGHISPSLLSLSALSALRIGAISLRPWFPWVSLGFPGFPWFPPWFPEGQATKRTPALNPHSAATFSDASISKSALPPSRISWFGKAASVLIINGRRVRREVGRVYRIESKRLVFCEGLTSGRPFRLLENLRGQTIKMSTEVRKPNDP